MQHAIVIAFLSLAACAGPAYAPRAEVPPPMPVARQLPASPAAPADEAATARWLQQEIDRQRGANALTAAATPAAPGDASEPAAAAPTDEAATRAWLDRTIEERRSAEPPPPAPIYQTVEHTVYVDRPVYYTGSRYRSAWYDDDCRYDGYRHYDDCGEPIYTSRSSYYRGSHRSSFPVHTVVGAGLGAIIGHQSHHRDRGAAIGAGIGLLLDLAH